MSQVPLGIAALESSAADAAALLKALANERRLAILCKLSSGEASVSALQDQLGLSQSALSQHLAILRKEGLLATRRKSQTILYRIVDPDALRIVETLAEIFCKERPT